LALEELIQICEPERPPGFHAADADLHAADVPQPDVLAQLLLAHSEKRGGFSERDEESFAECGSQRIQMMFRRDHELMVAHDSRIARIKASGNPCNSAPVRDWG
jgi:hypothetical protein